jgi:hypothetical protein
LGINPFTTPLLFGAAHLMMIGAGNILARTNIVGNLGEKFVLLPGFILLILAVLRFI